MNRVSIVGITAGNLIDIISTFIVSFLAAFLIAFFYAFSSGRAINPSSIGESGAFLAVSTILGSLCSVLAGYISARIAKHDEVLNGLLSSVACLGLSLFALLGGSVQHHLGMFFALVPLGPALSTFGGYLRLRQKK